MRQRIAQFLLSHQSQIQTLEKAALIGMADGITDATTRGLSGETLLVFVGFAVLRACMPVVENWLLQAQ